MKKILTLNLAFIFLVTSLSSSFAGTKKSTCENGECLPALVEKLENLGAIYQKQCLPKKIKDSQVEAWHEKNGFSEECWKYITEINNLEEQLSHYQNILESKLGCANGDCTRSSAADEFNSQLNSISKVEKELSCTAEKKAAVSKQCPADMNCALMSTALAGGGYIAEMMIPKNWKPKGCNLGDDSCMAQLATGFLKQAFTFFESVWGLLKIAGKKTRQAAKNFWNWVTDAEDHSSTSQLALSKASEDPGVFDMLVKDFPGTMKKIWQGLVASLKEWLKTDIFCQKWSGAPHLSKCLVATETLDCMPCKTMVNGLCAISGAIIAEVVPAFFTGGLTTAAKYGAQGAVKIAKLFKVSNATIKTLKASRLAKNIVKISSKADEVLKVSKGLRATKYGLEAAMAAVKTYMLSPTRKILKSSLGSLISLAKKGTAYVAVTPAGKVLIFSAKALKTTGKIILYPIDNPMLTASYKLGQRSFDKIFKLGAPKLAATAGVSAKIVKAIPEVENSLVKLEAARIAPKTEASVLTNLELESYAKILPHRQSLLKEALDEGDDLKDIIKNLYPELEYSSLAKTVGAKKVLAAEKELLLEISQLADGPIKESFSKKFHLKIAQDANRRKIIPSSHSYDKVIANSKLPQEKRFQEAMIQIKREPANELEKIKLARSLEEAHLFAPDNGVFEYSWRELREKYRILTEGGFTPDEADELIRVGLAGRPPVRELIKPGKTLFSGFAEDILDGDYLSRRELLFKLVKQNTPNTGNKLVRLITKNNDAQKIIDNFESLNFIDYQHSVPELENILSGSQVLKTAPMAERYEKLAFENFKKSRAYLLKNKPDLNKETLLSIHKKMLKGGVENAKDSQLGIIRDGHWFGNVPSSKPISLEIKNEIAKNPYLTWMESGELRGENFHGKILYPNSQHVRKEALDLIREKNEKLVLQIEEYQNLTKEISLRKAKIAGRANSPQIVAEKEAIQALVNRHTELDNIRLKMTHELVDSLVDQLMEWFTRERTLIGEINTPEKLDEFVNLLAKFQRDLVSIHPLANGNGRSSREFMNYALMKEGFPPARVIDPNADIYRSLEDWQTIIKHGILASDFLMDDLIERVKFGLPIENSVELITPYSRPPVKMRLIGEKKVPHMEGVEYIDPRLYREIVKRTLAQEPVLRRELTTNPLEAWDKIHVKANEVFSKNNIYYNHAKHGIGRVEIGYVDDDFKLLYGKSSYDNQELFDFKMKTWYSDDINWRGLASKHSEKSEAEIVDMFKELNSHMASNAVLKKIRGSATPATIKKAALEDFDKLNEDIFGDGLVKMAKDHSETGPMYGISYGYSTSKSRDVGKAFAMGAMVVGKYGEHKLPELQALLKSRVLVGARKSMKDVDLGRLKQLRPEFSYKYGRQQEVMGVGASDPDAIKIIQTIDAEGEVILTYLRNPEKADEIWVIKGEIEPNAIPEKNQIERTITLKR